jgi:anti-anti-sigma regulatory factor
VLKAATEQSPATGVTTLHLAGELTPATTATCRDLVGAAAAQCPVAVIVDLADLHQAAPRSLRVFVTATAEARQAWGVPVLLCAPNSEVRHQLEPFRGYVALYEHHSHAMLAVRAQVPRWVRQRFVPMPESVAGTRSLIADACRDWGLSHMRYTARLVASEMASNAIQHAGTSFDVTAGHTGRYLRIAVQDGSHTLPALVETPPPRSSIMAVGSGRGMRIMSGAGTHCGATRVPDGKIVWVLMLTDR